MAVAIVRDGEPIARFDNDGSFHGDKWVLDLLQGVTVVDSEGLVPPEATERYLAALPEALAGSRVWAEPVVD